MSGSIVADGNCLFRCIALSMFGDQDMHLTARLQITNRAQQLIKKPDWQDQWAVIKPTWWDLHKITGDPVANYDHYAEETKVEIWAKYMSKPGVYGDVGCLFLAADLYNADFHIRITGKFKHLSPMHIKPVDPHTQRKHKVVYLTLETHDNENKDHYTLDKAHCCQEGCDFE